MTSPCQLALEGVVEAVDYLPLRTFEWNSSDLALELARIAADMLVVLRERKRPKISSCDLPRMCMPAP
jgi:hypothetical protein